jgi:hypothetical protein
MEMGFDFLSGIVLLVSIFEFSLSVVVNGVLLPSIALNCLPGCYTRIFNCSGISGLVRGESGYSL